MGGCFITLIRWFTAFFAVRTQHRTACATEKRKRKKGQSASKVEACKCCGIRQMRVRKVEKKPPHFYFSSSQLKHYTLLLSNVTRPHKSESLEIWPFVEFVLFLPDAAFSA
jgi:hypothetical protein